MIDWIKSLLGFQTRADKAAERVAVAMEEIATDMEAARDLLRARFAEAPASVGSLPEQSAVNLLPTANGSLPTASGRRPSRLAKTGNGHAG